MNNQSTGWQRFLRNRVAVMALAVLLTVIYVADGIRVGPVDSPARQLDQMFWLGGAAPGSLVDGGAGLLVIDSAN